MLPLREMGLTFRSFGARPTSAAWRRFMMLILLVGFMTLSLSTQIRLDPRVGVKRRPKGLEAATTLRVPSTAPVTSETGAKNDPTSNDGAANSTTPSNSSGNTTFQVTPGVNGTQGNITATPTPIVDPAVLNECRGRFSLPSGVHPAPYRSSIDSMAAWRTYMDALLRGSPDGNVRIFFLGDSILREMYFRMTVFLRQYVPKINASRFSFAKPVPDWVSQRRPTEAELGDFSLGNVRGDVWPLNISVRNRSPIVLGWSMIRYFGTGELSGAADLVEKFAPTHVIVDRGAWDAIWGDGDSVSSGGRFCAEVADGFALLRLVVPNAIVVGVPMALLLPGDRNVIGAGHLCPSRFRARVMREAMMCGIHKYNHEHPAENPRDRVMAIDLFPYSLRFPHTALYDGLHHEDEYYDRLCSHLFGWIVQHGAPCLLPVEDVSPFLEPGGRGACGMGGQVTAGSPPLPSQCLARSTLTQMWGPDRTCMMGDLERELQAYENIQQGMLQQPRESLAQCAVLLVAFALTEPDDRWMLDVVDVSAAARTCLRFVEPMQWNQSDVENMQKQYLQFNITCRGYWTILAKIEGLDAANARVECTKERQERDGAISYGRMVWRVASKQLRKKHNVEESVNWCKRFFRGLSPVVSSWPEVLTYMADTKNRFATAFRLCADAITEAMTVPDKT